MKFRRSAFTLVVKIQGSLVRKQSSADDCFHPLAVCLDPIRFAKDMIETSPQNRHLGYARVSTYGQTLDAQPQQFRAEAPRQERGLPFPQ